MSMNRGEFIRLVEAYCEKDPEAITEVGEAARRGINKRMHAMAERAADMEVALAAALAKRNRRVHDKIIEQKIERWRGESSLRWDWYFDQERGGDGD